MIPNPVTSRYLHHLLYEGRNENFELRDLEQTQVVDKRNIPVPGSFYYFVVLVTPVDDFQTYSGTGATPRQAIQNALRSAGVEFR